ncbi:hypothetical protein BKA69DRAFT_327736 [Paraphysoderma sedebokerense]|nr:hypothetical protein BKA69DRAFT_327736 [Paraphysoderma sedebokerense]
MTVAADPQYFYIRKALNGFGSGHELITVGRFRNPDTVDVVEANQTSITLYSLETESQISTLPVLEPLTTYPVIGNITAISTINLSDQQRIINERQFPFGKSQNSSLIDPKELFGGEVDSISGLDVWKYLKSLEGRESEDENNQGRDELEIKYECDYLVTDVLQEFTPASCD